MSEITEATDAQVERWAETGTGYTLEAEHVSVANGDATERYRLTAAQRTRLQQAAGEHETDPT